MPNLTTYRPNGRREDVATLLSGHGPRVHLSVSSVRRAFGRRVDTPPRQVHEFIDVLTDQVRPYTTAQTLAERTIIGASTVENGPTTRSCTDRAEPGEWEQCRDSWRAGDRSARALSLHFSPNVIAHVVSIVRLGAASTHTRRCRWQWRSPYAPVHNLPRCANNI